MPDEKKITAKAAPKTEEINAPEAPAKSLLGLIPKEGSKGSLTAIMLGIGAVLITFGVVMFVDYMRRRKISKLEHNRRVLEDKLHVLETEEKLKANDERRKALNVNLKEAKKELTALKREQKKRTRALESALKNLEKARGWDDV